MPANPPIQYPAPTCAFHWASSDSVAIAMSYHWSVGCSMLDVLPRIRSLRALRSTLFRLLSFFAAPKHWSWHLGSAIGKSRRTPRRFFPRSCFPEQNQKSQPIDGSPQASASLHCFVASCLRGKDSARTSPWRLGVLAVQPPTASSRIPAPTRRLRPLTSHVSPLTP